jgi:hypothetical protein
VIAVAACQHLRKYFCPRTGGNECPDCGGFDVCCDRPSAHQQPADDDHATYPRWNGVEDVNDYLARHDVRPQ